MNQGALAGLIGLIGWSASSRNCVRDRLSGMYGMSPVGLVNSTMFYAVVGGEGSDKVMGRQ